MASDFRYYSWAAAAPWVVGRTLFGSAPSADAMAALALAHPLLAPPKPKFGAKAFRPPVAGFSLATLGKWLGGLVAAEASAGLTPLSKAPAMVPRKSSKKKVGSKPKAKVAKKSLKGKAKDEAPATGAAARKQRLAAEAEARERAAREAEARRRMDLEASDFLPQSGDDETVEVDAEGEPARRARANWNGDESDDEVGVDGDEEEEDENADDDVIEL